ncbi:MAG: cheBR [Rhodocyclales bacterium]|nr:cheBR [Rhodocyclales bacterium]
MSDADDSLTTEECKPGVGGPDFPVVGIGASAGGLQAVSDFLRNMPGDSGMAFVLIMHLSPTHDSKLDKILQSVTPMPVLQITEPAHIEPNHVYVISPNQHLSMEDGMLLLSPLDRPRERHVAIDLFFRTLAETHRERAICIVLSGTGSDGTVGLMRVKEHGGIAIAQSIEEAEHDGMPRSAIATGVIDFTLPVAEMPQKLIALWQNARAIELPKVADLNLKVSAPSSEARSAAAEEALHDIMVLLRARTGHDFRHYKRATVLRRIERRLQVNALPDLPTYRNFLQQNLEETPALLKDMLISVTNFFRDRDAFTALEHEVIPHIFSDRSAGEQVRVWVAGCATGEEAYSVSMLLWEAKMRQPEAPDIQVFATDIDAHAIAVGRTASYPESTVADVSRERLGEFFTKEPLRYRVRKSVREKVLFAAHNILRDPPFSRLDLVCCRNLMIYLDRAVQTDVLEMLHFALRPGGYLFLGTSESADAASQYFSVVDKKNRIYRANPVARSARYVPTLPLGALDGAAVPSQTSVPERRYVPFAELHQKLLEQYAPPSVLVSHDHEIVHLTERAGEFLRYASGVPSHNLLALIHPDLRLELRTAMFQASQTGKSVDARRVQLHRDGRAFYVNMTARPVHDNNTATDFILVIFNEVEDTTSAHVPTDDTNGSGFLVEQLEEELHGVKQQLQLTIEQAETSNEELKASNEELQAINEELRSATEELETSREELQSINEELITVNHELKAKVEETGKINDDLQNLIASTDIATVFIDSGMRIKRYTPRATEVFSIIPSDIGRSLLDITHRLEYETLASDAIEAFRSLRASEREVRSSDGKWYIARVLPYRTTENRIDGAVLTYIDISGRRHAEEALRRGEEQMRLVAESTRDYAIITMDNDGNITGWNVGAHRIFGYTEEEAIGQPAALIFTAEDRERGAPAMELSKAHAEGRAEDERWHRRKDGTTFYCSGMTTLLQGRKGFAKIARDLTGKKLQEADREDMLKQAKAASELKDDLLAVMSHELKHPLNLIHVNAELLTRIPQIRDAPHAARAADTIRRTVLGQAQIIDDLLDLSRVRMGKLSLHRAGVPWAVIVDDIVGAMKNEAEAKNVSIKLEVTDSGMVFVDPTRLEQIVWNLLSNAIKFTSSGDSITVRLSQDEGFGKLEVQDTGQGIAPEFIGQVFDMFRQAGGRPTTRKEGGLGIGCALVQQLAEAHGGRVSVASAGVGQGTAFSVWLPLYRGGKEIEEWAPRDSGGLAGQEILLVDDTLETLESFSELLKLDGGVVTAVPSAEKALSVATRKKFDLIISDIAMPGMDGHELMRELRKMDNTRDVPAIALTGFGRPNDAQLALQAGFDAHVSKPVSLESLVQTVESVIARKRARG